MSAYVLTGILCSIALTLGTIGALLAWVYKRGKTESTYEASMVANTQSNEKLTASVDKLEDSLTAGFLQVHERLNGHDIRIALNERDITYLQQGARIQAGP